jgi:hypothetical protein
MTYLNKIRTRRPKANVQRHNTIAYTLSTGEPFVCNLYPKTKTNLAVPRNRTLPMLIWKYATLATTPPIFRTEDLSAHLSELMGTYISPMLLGTALQRFSHFPIKFNSEPPNSYAYYKFGSWEEVQVLMYHHIKQLDYTIDPAEIPKATFRTIIRHYYTDQLPLVPKRDRV